ncbi:MAG: hypothetical protein EBX50_19085 [Chitinophagia bacterium]|nr:hypothetical protein [Chitinophagia bacterium]
MSQYEFLKNFMLPDDLTRVISQGSLKRVLELSPDEIENLANIQSFRAADDKQKIALSIFAAAAAIMCVFRRPSSVAIESDEHSHSGVFCEMGIFPESPDKFMEKAVGFYRTIGTFMGDRPKESKGT